MFSLPTYQRCLEITNSNPVFYESKFNIDGYSISIFNYRYPQYSDFLNNSAFELRGLTFVFDGNNYKRFPLLEKFFNLGENESTNYEYLRNKEIKSAKIKEDGSVISFIQLPNGRILAKSKTSFESYQAKLAQNIFETDSTLKSKIISWLNDGINPIFELVSPKNKVVVDYSKTQLILISLRTNNGDYIDINSCEISKANTINLTLDDMMSLKSTQEGYEGWVVEFMDGQKVKIKTDWYLSLHRIFTEDSQREDYLIQMYFDEKIDDLISLHSIGSESRLFIESVVEKTKEKIDDLKSNLNLLLSNYNGDRKSFSLENSDHKYFGLCMKIIGGGNREEIISEYIKKVTYRLEGARKWLWD